MSSKTLIQNSYPVAKKRDKTFQTIDIMKTKEENLKPDETKDTGIHTGLNNPETANNAGHLPVSTQTASSKTRLFRRRSLEVARESFVQKPGIFHLSIEKPDTKYTTDHPQSSFKSPKGEVLTLESGNIDLPKPCQSELSTPHSLNNKCGHLRSSSSLAFSYNSSSGSSSSSSSQSLSSPHESYLSQSLNSGQYREKQLRKNTQNLKNCLSHEDIPKISCLLQTHQEQHRIIPTYSLGTSPPSLGPNIKGPIGSTNLKTNGKASLKSLKSLPTSFEICQKKTSLKCRDSDISLDKEKTPKDFVSENEPEIVENRKNSESVEKNSTTKKCRPVLKNLKSLPNSSNVFHEKINLKHEDINIFPDKETSLKVLVSAEEPRSVESKKIPKSETQDPVRKKDLCNKPGLISPEFTDFFPKTVQNQTNCSNQTDLPDSSKVNRNQQKTHRSSTAAAKIENASSQKEIQQVTLFPLQKKRMNYQAAISSLRPKDVGVCISSATIHKRRERNAISKQLQNKGCVFEAKNPESMKPLLSELPKHHKVKMARNGENKPLLDILAQQSRTTSVTKLNSCVKIEDMFENLRERKNEENQTIKKTMAAVEQPSKILKNVSSLKLTGSKPNEKQALKKGNTASNQKRSNEKDTKVPKNPRKQQIKSKRKKTPQLPTNTTPEEDLHSKLGSNLALISGPDWHIVTDCVDMSNVEVVNDSNIYSEYALYVKSQQTNGNENGIKKNETSQTIDDFCNDFINDFMNDKEKDKNLSHSTGNIRNISSSEEKLAPLNEYPEILKKHDLLTNNDLRNAVLSSSNSDGSKQVNVLAEDLSAKDGNEHCKDFNKDVSQSEDNVLENPKIKFTDSDSEYDTDFECLSVCESDSLEDEESLCDKMVDRDCLSRSPETKSPEVNQENLDSVVEELLNYSTSPVCLEKRLSNISLPESDSILLRSLKHKKDSPFYAPNKNEDNSVAEGGFPNDVQENLQVSATKKSLDKCVDSKVVHRLNSVDESFSDKETESLSQLDDLSTKHDGSCRRDSTSTTSSFLSIGEDFSWKKGDLLGSGAFGRVWRGLTSNGEQIAVKQIMLDVTDREKAEREYQKVREEVEILKTLQHKNIVSFLGMRREGEEVSIFMQYVTGGSIAQLLARFGPLDEPVFCTYTQQILEGVKYLHDKNVIHRDIKGGNVMLMPNSTIKLVDFGCAKRLCYTLNKNSLCNPTSLQGTPYWMAPEVVQETGHGKKSDIWSIGCTVFEMATKNPPWSNMNPYAAIFAICSSKPVPCLPSEFSQKAQDFVRVCLTRDPTKRPTARELLQDKFITTPHHDRRRKSVTCFN